MTHRVARKGGSETMEGGVLKVWGDRGRISSGVRFCGMIPGRVQKERKY